MIWAVCVMNLNVDRWYTGVFIAILIVLHGFGSGFVNTGSMSLASGRLDIRTKQCSGFIVLFCLLTGNLYGTLVDYVALI